VRQGAQAHDDPLRLRRWGARSSIIDDVTRAALVLAAVATLAAPACMTASAAAFDKDDRHASPFNIFVMGGLFDAGLALAAAAGHARATDEPDDRTTDYYLPYLAGLVAVDLLIAYIVVQHRWDP
jgi:hypothetical protein